MMAQDFQDLTGQIIRRVINLVQEVEDNLVELIRLSGSVESAVADKVPAQKSCPDGAVMQGLGPQVPGLGETAGAVSGQDEVDDLLSSLGF